MAGALKEFTMPNPALAKKRERSADVQDELWQKMGVEPVEIVEGKAEDEKASDMLNMLEKTQKAEKSGAADLKDVEKAKEAFIDAAKAAIQTKDPPMEEAVKKTIEFGQNLVDLAGSYLTQFVGMVAGRLADRDTRKYYKWNRTSLLNVEGVNTIEDLVRKNYHLGKPILTVLVEQYGVFNTASKYIVKSKKIKPVSIPKGTSPVPPLKTEAELIGPRFDAIRLIRQPRDTADILDDLLESQEAVGFPTEQKRQWLFSVLDLAAFEFLLGDSSLGAITMALGQVKRIRGCERFELKQLILSEGVRDIFAIFVAFQYLMSSGGNAYAGRSSQMGNAKGTTFMLSAGLETRKMLYAQIETAQYWFQDVYEVENPLKQELTKHKDKLQKELDSMFVPLIDQGTTNIDWKATILDLKKTSTLQDIISQLEATLTLETSLPPQVKTYLTKSIEFFRLEQILPQIIPTVLQHAN